MSLHYCVDEGDTLVGGRFECPLQVKEEVRPSGPSQVRGVVTINHGNNCFPKSVNFLSIMVVPVSRREGRTSGHLRNVYVKVRPGSEGERTVGLRVNPPVMWSRHRTMSREKVGKTSFTEITFTHTSHRSLFFFLQFFPVNKNFLQTTPSFKYLMNAYNYQSSDSRCLTTVTNVSQGSLESRG